MAMLTTTDRLYHRYNTYAGRPSVSNREKRSVMFGSLQRVLGKVLPADRSSPILDVACGEGSLLSFLKENGYRNLYGFDLSPENVFLCHNLGLDFVRRFDALSVADYQPAVQFETIFVLDLLEHLPKQAAAGFLGALRLRLRPGGSLIVQTLNLGCLFGLVHRYNDLSHEFGVTETSARILMSVAGFDPECVTIAPVWSATFLAGRIREFGLHLTHRLVYLLEGSGRPRIPTKDLLIRAVVP